MANEKVIALSIRLPIRLRNRSAKRAKSVSRSLNQHIVYLLERDVRDAETAAEVSAQGAARNAEEAATA